MAELLSVGLDVGTTTTQLIVSRLTVENRASSFAVPELQIARREILYKSPIHFTPLLGGERVDGEGIRAIVSAEYAQAGICREEVDTGAVIITGETSRKENARAVLQALSDFAGEFVVATAGPDLESILAAQGAGAVALSEGTGKTVLHMDIGGGTSNLAWIEDGKITATGCLNIGGRLLKFQENGTISYISPVLKDLPKEPEALAPLLAQALEMAAGLRPATELLGRLTTQETGRPLAPKQADIISFSGGVADCIASDLPPLAFGDMGPALGRAIRQSRLCQGEYVLGSETIRATVIGAGCHSTQLSGSTVFLQNVALPLKNLPVVALPNADPAVIRARFAGQDTQPVLALQGLAAPGYGQLQALAQDILRAIPAGPIYLALEQDMAKALGVALSLAAGQERPIICLDRLRLPDGSYLDIGEPIGPALSVVSKTLILER